MTFDFEQELRRFAERHPQQAGEVQLFVDFLREQSAPFSRSTRIGHFTGSAWLVSGDGERVLLTHHRKLQRWLQLGGHADGDPDVRAVALREAVEESGLSSLSVDSEIFDLDRHRIPARGNEPDHWHYDVRFVVRCQGSERFQVSAESHALAWRDIREIAEAVDLDDALPRMARRWLEQAA